MGSNCKSYGGGKCGCNKRVKKAQRVPQRGPGVAELEKILSDQKQDCMNPLYTATPNGPSHYHLMQLPMQHERMIPFPRPLAVSHFTHSDHGSRNAYIKSLRSDGAVKSDSGMISFTQMMMMGDPDHDSKPNANLLFQTNYAMKKAGEEMSSNNHPVYVQQPGQASIDNGRPMAEHEKMMLRNILTLGPPSPTKGSSTLPLNTIFIESDSSDEQCKGKKTEESSNKSHQSQIFGFNLTDKSLSLDDTKLSLHHNAARAEELSLDLTLKI